MLIVSLLKSQRNVASSSCRRSAWLSFTFDYLPGLLSRSGGLTTPLRGNMSLMDFFPTFSEGNLVIYQGFAVFAVVVAEFLVQQIQIADKAS
jgi:hypothetical protein